jgi:hypothetical protein
MIKIIEEEINAFCNIYKQINPTSSHHENAYNVGLLYFFTDEKYLVISIEILLVHVDKYFGSSTVISIS